MPTNRPEPLPEKLTLTATMQIVADARATSDDPAPLPRFSMVAYTGGAMRLEGWKHPVVVDLAGLAIPSQNRPIRVGHHTDRLVGHTQSIAQESGQLVAAGVLSIPGPDTERVIAGSRNGFPWQASIGARVDQFEFVKDGQIATANGHEFAGPVVVVRKSTLGEISFVDLGADGNTTARVAAATPTSIPEVSTMSASTMTENTTATAVADAVAAVRTATANETKRIAAIRTLCAGAFPDIEARAIADGWDAVRTELEVLRQKRPSGPALHSSGTVATAAAVEAALCLSVRMPEEDVVNWYGAPAVEAARSRDLRGMGLHELFFHVIHAVGGHARPGQMTDETIRTAFEADRTIRAAGGSYSTINLSGILSNVANKSLLQAYSAVDSVATVICAQTDVNDFKQITRYRMTGQGTFEKVGADGELKHANLTEEAYTNQIDTYGKIITLTRKMIINDDLGAFLQIPRILGRQSALAVEKAVFTLLLANPGGFFSGPNKNLQSGAATALQISSLTAAEELFDNQTDKTGDPILVKSAILLVPTGLKVTAQQLMTETRVNETTTTEKPKPANNPHAGKWQPYASPYLNAQGLAGSSPTAWYLFADPADVAAMEIAYLRGQRTPTIESGETDFDTLGMKWRGYFDFGVGMQDYRAAVKSTGT